MKNTARVLLCGILAAGLLAGCGKGEKIDSTLPAVTVDGESVSMGEALFYLRAQQAETQTMMESYGFVDGNSFWGQTTTDDDGNEITYAQQLKDSVLDELTEYMLLRSHASDYDIEMPAEVSDAAAENAKTVYEANTDVLEEIGTTEDDIRNVMELYAYPQLMKDAMTADVDVEVSDEEAAQTRVIYCRIRLKEEDEEGNQVDASDETKETYHGMMEDLLAQMQEAEEVDEESVREMANAIDEELIMVGSTSYGKDDAYLPEEVLTAAESLQDGETYDGVIETADGFYYLVNMVAVLDREATDIEKNSIVSERQQEAFDALVQEWKDAAEISNGEEWEKVTVSDTEQWKAAAS